MSTPARLVSLDAFRGLTIAFMVLVNNAGSERDSYAQLRHADWHGWTLTDTVFPTFLWIVGVSITLSFSRRLAKGATRGALLRDAVRRAAILFLLGLAVYAFPHFNLGTQRILGVLQRIAICFLAGAALFLYTNTRGRIIALLTLLATYWVLMFYVPVPGYGPGRLDVESNFAHYVDQHVLGAHNYAHTKTWDPEGLVSTLPAIGTTIFGLLAGTLLAARRLSRMVALGALLLVAGLVLDHWLPINKKLWTDSFCLFMAGFDFLLLTAFVWAVDLRGWRAPVRPFAILGLNAIAVYMASEFLAEALDAFHLQHRIYNSVFVPIASPANASLLYSLAFTAVMFLLAYVLYRRHWIIRV
jgi:predicted acyltransferase